MALFCLAELCFSTQLRIRISERGGPSVDRYHLWNVAPGPSIHLGGLGPFSRRTVSFGNATRGRVQFVFGRNCDGLPAVTCSRTQ